jgi:GT2 family glycosyltransferase
LKPDYAPERLWSQPYVDHLLVFRRSLLAKVSVKPLDRPSRHELALRLCGQARSVVHVGQILYHERHEWRGTVLRPASGIQAALRQRGLRATVARGFVAGTYRVQPRIPASASVSILIPYRDAPDLLDRCLTTLRAKTRFSRYEVVLIDNGSVLTETRRLAERWLTKMPGRRLEVPGPFNYAHLNNVAARAARGTHLLLLNNDTEIIERDWLTALLEWGCQPDVGAVGGKLLYPDGTLQHAGVLLGVAGLAAHAYLGLPRDVAGYHGGPQIMTNVSGVTGACLLVEKKKYLAVKGLDEVHFKVAFNDLDLCLKLAARGWRTVYTPYATLIHHESKSRGGGATVDEDRVFSRRWRTVIERDPFYHPLLSRLATDFRLR